MLRIEPLYISLIFGSLLGFLICACGVKAPPLPPLPTTPDQMEAADLRSSPSPLPSASMEPLRKKQGKKR
jgi:hypothetical protein